MPNWYFLVVRHFGGPDQRRQTCTRIKQQVEQQGLPKVLPLVKYELGRQREYYLGIAVDKDAEIHGSDAEEVARRLLVNAGVGAAANPQSSFFVEAEKVQRLLSGTVGCESFTFPMAYEAGGEAEAPPTDRLLAELDLGELRHAEPSTAESEQYSRLLYWCSAAGSGELGRIRQACQTLGIVSEWGGAWSVLRRLVLLGHLEFDGGGSFRWSIIPPTLVTPAEDGGYKILTGQRTPAIVQDLSNRFQVEERPQANGPPRLLVHGAGDDIFYRPGRRVQDVGSVSRQMIELLPTIEEWVLRLPTWDERDFGRFTIERYEPLTDEFHQVPGIPGQPQSGFYRFTFENRGQRMVTVAFFDNYADRWTCGDYYGLRFMARTRSRLCLAIYHADAHQLLIPAIDRWPMPYERTLVLASGSLPQKPESGPFILVYEGITPELAERMCTLLGLEMEGS